MRNLPWLLVSARLRTNIFRAISTSAVVALSFISLLGIQGISHATSNSLVSYSLYKLNAGQENLTINSAQAITSMMRTDSIDNYLKTKLQKFSAAPPTREIIYRALSDTHGTSFYFGAIENLSPSIRLISGRFPASCSASICEVIQIGGDPKLAPRPASYGLTIVGRGEIRDSLLYSGTMGAPAGTALLLADGISKATSLAQFASTDGTSAWVEKIDASKITQLGTDSYIAQMVAFEDHLSIDFPELVVTWPQDALSNASDQAATFSGKLTLLKFAVVTLFLAFLALITATQRRDHFQFRASLSRIGTPKWTLTWELLFESAIPLVLGVVLTGAASLLIPRTLHGLNYHVNLTDLYLGWPKYILLIASAESLAVGITLFKDHAWRRIQIIALILAPAFFVLYLQQNRVNDSRYFTIPFVYAVGPVLICYLILRYLLSLLREKQKQNFIIFKEFFGLWQGVTSMIALAGIIAMLSLGYGSGLARQVAIQSQNQVPLDLSLFTGSNLVRPLDVAGARDYANVQPHSLAFPILRTGSSIRGQNAVSESLSLIGMPAGALALADPALKKYAESQVFDSVVPQRGVAVGSTKVISITLAGIPPEIDSLGWFLTPNGTYISAAFVGTSSVRTLTLKGEVPTNSFLVAFEFREASNYLSRRLHAINEGNYSVPKIVGVGSIGSVLFDGKAQAIPPSIWGSANFPFSFDGQSLYIQPRDETGIPSAVTDPTTAALAVNGILTLLGTGNTYTQVRVGEVVPTFPSAGDRFVIMELAAMQSKITQHNLGALDPIEVWIKTPTPEKFAQIMALPRYQGLSFQSRFAVQKALSSDPNNVGLLDAYRIALALALLMSFLISLAALPLFYREGAAVLYQLEVLGYKPTELRRGARFAWRSALVVGLFVGVALGILISRIFLSPSIPLVEDAALLVAAYLIIEISSALLSRSYLKEELLVRR